MKGTVIAIEPTDHGAMAALARDGRLEDLLIDPPDDLPRAEEVHLVRVKRLIPAQGGAHVNMSDGRKGFLRDAKGLKEGALVIAQVTGFAAEGKPTPLTTRRLHRGRCVILTPGVPGVNVARAIKDRAERERLAAIPVDLIEADGAGVILRSAAANAEADTIRSELGALLALEARVVAPASAPARLIPAPGVEALAEREWAGEPGVETVRGAGAFDRFGLWEEIERLRGPRTALAGTFWLSIEPTAALVAVDVNTGGDFASASAARANLAAAADLPRALRLRGLAGQITVDFAPMRKSDRRAVEAALKKALADDPVQTTIAGWTPLGHLELQRKRERRPIADLLP